MHTVADICAWGLPVHDDAFGYHDVPEVCCIVTGDAEVLQAVSSVVVRDLHGAHIRSTGTAQQTHHNTVLPAPSRTLQLGHFFPPREK